MWRRWMVVREQMGCWGRAEEPPVPPKRPAAEVLVLNAFYEFRQSIIERMDDLLGSDRKTRYWPEPCQGYPSVWKDDADANGGWGNVVRAYEE